MELKNIKFEVINKMILIVEVKGEWGVCRVE